MNRPGKPRLEAIKYDSCIGKAKLAFRKTRLVSETEREIGKNPKS